MANAITERLQARKEKMKVVTDKLNDQWLESKLKEIQEVNGYYQQCRDKIIEALENHDYINDSVIMQYNANVKYLRENGAITEGGIENDSGRKIK